MGGGCGAQFLIEFECRLALCQVKALARDEVAECLDGVVGTPGTLIGLGNHPGGTHRAAALGTGNEELAADLDGLVEFASAHLEQNYVGGGQTTGVAYDLAGQAAVAQALFANRIAGPRGCRIVDIASDGQCNGLVEIRLEHQPADLSWKHFPFGCEKFCLQCGRNCQRRNQQFEQVFQFHAARCDVVGLDLGFGEAVAGPRRVLAGGRRVLQRQAWRSRAGGAAPARLKLS